MLTPLSYYLQQQHVGLIQEDSQQLNVIHILQKIYEQLVAEACESPKSLAKLWNHGKRRSPIKGLYVWGDVGIGKTFMMDIFYQCCSSKKMRLHFHEFLQRIHAELNSMQGHVNPLQKIARKLRSEVRVICFDEFFISDIADAMILGELFQSLFLEGICLIATSNIAPDDLYKEGLQRERFLPAIVAIKHHMTLYHMLSHQDYRLTHLPSMGTYFWPMNAEGEHTLEKAFLRLAGTDPMMEGDIELFGRAIKTRKQTKHIIWFDFETICGPPRSQKDYIAMAGQYSTVFISGVPVFQPGQLNVTTAFINLVDIFYDEKVRLVILAEADIEDLYPSGKLRFEFARVQSRLIEMQSADYFNR